MSPGQSLARSIIAHWPVVLAILAGAVAWGATSQRVVALEERINVSDINRERLIRIERDVSHLADELQEIKDTKRITRDAVQTNQRHIMEIKGQLRVLLETLRGTDQ